MSTSFTKIPLTSEVPNDSSVAGVTLKNALENLEVSGPEITQYNVGNLDFGQSATITHPSDPDYKRFIDVTQHATLQDSSLYFVPGIDLTYEDETKVGIDAQNSLGMISQPYLDGMVCSYWYTDDEAVDKTPHGRNMTLTDCTFMDGQVQKTCVMNGTTSYGSIANEVPTGYVAKVQAWSNFDFSDNPIDGDTIGCVLFGVVFWTFIFKDTPGTPPIYTSHVQIGLTLEATIDNLVSAAATYVDKGTVVLTKTSTSQVKISMGYKYPGTIGNTTMMEVAVWVGNSRITISHVAEGSARLYGGSDAVNPSPFCKTRADIFSIHFWLQRFSFPAYGAEGDVISLWNEENDRRSWRIYIDQTGPTAGALKMDMSLDGVNVAYTIASSYPVIMDYQMTDVWFLFHTDGEVHLFINGSQHAYYTLPFNFYELFYNDVDPVLVGAKHGATGIDNFLNGRISDTCIVKGITYFDSMYSFHQKESSGQHLGGFDTSGSWYVTTTDNSQVDTSSWDAMTSFGVQNWSWYGTALFLVSTDGRNTWKKWNGSVFETVNLADIKTQGNTTEELQGLVKVDWDTIFADTFDVAICLGTNNPDNGPEVEFVYLNALVPGKSSFSCIYTKTSPTETVIFNSNALAYDVLVNILMC